MQIKLWLACISYSVYIPNRLCSLDRLKIYSLDNAMPKKIVNPAIKELILILKNIRSLNSSLRLNKTDKNSLILMLDNIF